MWGHMEVIVIATDEVAGILLGGVCQCSYPLEPEAGPGYNMKMKMSVFCRVVPCIRNHAVISESCLVAGMEG